VNPDADRIVDQQWTIKETGKLWRQIGQINQVLGDLLARLEALENRKPALRRSTYPIPDGLFENLHRQGFHRLSRADYPTITHIHNLSHHLHKWCEEAGEDHTNYFLRTAGPENIMILARADHK
jgi:hypothetical protein